MECLGLALKNGGATPTGSDLFHYHLDKRIRIETVEGKRIVQIFQASSPLSVWCRSEVLRGILMDIANELRRKLAEAPSP
jgi:hypothetical protein